MLWLRAILPLAPRVRNLETAVRRLEAFLRSGKGPRSSRNRDFLLRLVWLELTDAETKGAFGESRGSEAVASSVLLLMKTEMKGSSDGREDGGESCPLDATAGGSATDI
jgi:hypothetical protein